MSLGLLVPTRNRAFNARRLATAFEETVTGLHTKLIFVVDHDDPCKQEYLDTLPEWVTVCIVPEDGPKRMGPVLNFAASWACHEYSHLGFMGDDHLPRTLGWDDTILNIMGDSPGVAYGDDLHQGGKLATACVITSKIVRTLGYMSPPPLEHLYIDNFWMTLGSTTNLWYVPDVIIEHLHPDAGKAQRDTGYDRDSGFQQMSADQARWASWYASSWPADRTKLLEAL
jgi:hypothetical protein